MVSSLDAPPLYGLVLAGGFSKRMGQDKALLCYGGRSNQLTTCSKLLENHCQKTFVSLRHEQRFLAEYRQVAVICDDVQDTGPIGGILAALKSNQQVAWLVIAVDLVFLDEQTLQTLKDHRDIHRYATAYRSADGQYIEPLCTIYEPQCYEPFVQLFRQGLRSPARMLANLGAHTLEHPSHNQLANFNEPTPLIQKPVNALLD